MDIDQPTIETEQPLPLPRLRDKLSAWYNNPGFKRYFHNTGWSLMARFFSLGVSFIISVLVARYLGPANLGQLSYAVSFVGIFSFIANLGIDNILYRELIRYPEKRDVLMGTALRLKIFAGSIAAVIAIFSAYMFFPIDISFWLICLISLTYVFSAWNIIVYEFQAHVEQKYPAIISFFIVILLNVLKIAIMVSHKGIIYFSVVLLLEPIFYAICYSWARRKRYGTTAHWKFDTAVAKMILIDSWPLMISSTFILIYSRIDQIMIKQYIDSASVGVYDAAVRISEAWSFIPGIIASSLFPAIVNAKKVSDTTYKKRLLSLSGFLALLAIAVAVPTTLLSHQIIQLLYGDEFIRSSTILSIYIWSGLWTSLGTMVGYYLISENKRILLFSSTFLAMVINIILNFMWLPSYGIVGAAWATFISYAFLALPLIRIPFVKHTTS